MNPHAAGRATMMPSQTRRQTLLAVLLHGPLAITLGGSFPGCGRQSGRDMIAANNDTNIKRLGTLYGLFHLRNELRGPRDEAEFRAFIAAQDPARLALAGIQPTSLDALFASERDRLPFRVRYGVNTRVRGPDVPVVFEESGRDGRRQVGFTGGVVHDVDAATYDNLWTGKTDGQSESLSAGDRGF